MTDRTALDTLLARARRRWLFNVVIESAALGLGAAMAGVILLLLAGTQILDWYWPVVLFAAAFTYSAWRTARRMPATYLMAQRIDRRLGLPDTLSTALFFRDTEVRAERSIVETQRADAENVARASDPRSAVPLLVPRAMYAAAALLMVAGGMFLVRYGVLRTLDLRQPLVEAMFDYFRPTQVATRNRPPAFPTGDKPLGVSLDNGERQLDPAPESALDVSDIPQFDDSPLANTERAGKNTAPAEPGQKGEEQGESGENAEGSRGDPQKSGQPESGQKGGQSQSKEGQKGPQSPENSSLMNKLKDAMANLMAKLNTPPQGGQQNESSGQKAGGQKSGMQQSEKGQQASGKPEGQGTPSDNDNGQPGQPGEQAQAGQSNSNDRSSDQADAKTGSGKSDGNKEAREAAQLEAMGKISEIFGRRAANVTGEVMVEVNSGKQQALKTPYSSRTAMHRDAGGEVSRDEIPLAFQHYVQQYFDEVRKPAPAAKPAKPPAR